MKTSLVTDALIGRIECERCHTSWPVAVKVEAKAGQPEPYAFIEMRGTLDEHVSRASIEAAKAHICEGDRRVQIEAEDGTILRTYTEPVADAPLLSHTANRREEMAGRDERFALRARECPNCGSTLTHMSGFGPPEQRLLCVAGCGRGYPDPDESPFAVRIPEEGVISAEQVKAMGEKLMADLREAGAEISRQFREAYAAGLEQTRASGEAGSGGLMGQFPASFVSDDEQAMINDRESRLIAGRVAADRQRGLARACICCAMSLAECRALGSGWACCGECGHPTQDDAVRRVSSENEVKASSSPPSKIETAPEPITRGKAQEATPVAAGPWDSRCEACGMTHSSCVVLGSGQACCDECGHP